MSNVVRTKTKWHTWGAPLCVDSWRRQKEADGKTLVCDKRDGATDYLRFLAGIHLTLKCFALNKKICLKEQLAAQNAG